MTHNIIERIDNFLNEQELPTWKDVIKSLKKKIKFSYKAQGANIYINTKVDIKDFLKKLEEVMPVEIRIRLKTDERPQAFINRGKTTGPFLVAIYFDGNR